MCATAVSGRCGSAIPTRSPAPIPRVRSAFVVAEVSLAVVLVVGAGLLIQSFARLASVNPGFDSASVLTVRVQLPGTAYRENPRRIGFFRELAGRFPEKLGVKVEPVEIGVIEMAGPAGQS